MAKKIGRSDPCPCGSGKKYKKCHGTNRSFQIGNQVKVTQQAPAAKASIPRESLGLPGAAYQLHTQGRGKGEPPKPPSPSLQDNYRVVLTLGRATPDFQNLSFESGVAGDSYIQFAKPEKERTASDFDEMAIFFGHGNERLEITGSANQDGRLAKLAVETPAPSFPEAEKIVSGAASPFLSAMAFELDVPVRLIQMDVTQKSTGNGSMTYTCPYTEMVPTGYAHNNVPYVQSLLSLYREGINSNSPNY